MTQANDQWNGFYGMYHQPLSSQYTLIKFVCGEEGRGQLSAENSDNNSVASTPRGANDRGLDWA